MSVSSHSVGVIIPKGEEQEHLIPHSAFRLCKIVSLKSGLRDSAICGREFTQPRLNAFLRGMGWLESEFGQHCLELFSQVLVQECWLIRRRLRCAGAKLVVDESSVDPVKPE